MLAVAADTAVTLRVDDRAGVAEGAPLKLLLAQLHGAAAHCQDQALAVVVQAVGVSTQCAVDGGEGHAGGHSLLPHGQRASGWAWNYMVRSLAGGQGHGGGGVVLV